MRISDWSSDVCSSDLGRSAGVGFTKLIDGCHLADIHTRAFGKPLRFAGRKPCRIIHHVPHDLGSHTGPRSADRKSVVSGKSVSVRVDLGGRRIITNTTGNMVSYV